MDNMKRSLKYQAIETKRFIFGFWSTMIIVNIMFYILNIVKGPQINVGFSLGDALGINAISVAGINLMAMFIALIAYNYDRSYQSFPLARSLSMTRKDYFISLLINNIIIVFVSSVIQTILLKIDPVLIQKGDKEPLYEFINFNLKTDNIFFIIFSLFILFTIFSSVSSLLASLNYKFGYKLWIVIVGFNIIISTFNIQAFERFLVCIGDIIATRYGIFETGVIFITLTIINISNYLIIINSGLKRNSV